MTDHVVAVTAKDLLFSGDTNELLPVYGDKQIPSNYLGMLHFVQLERARGATFICTPLLQIMPYLLKIQTLIYILH